MSEQELNLFYLSAGSMAQLCTGSAQIVGSKVVQLHPFNTPPNHVPDHILKFTCSVDERKGDLM